MRFELCSRNHADDVCLTFVHALIQTKSKFYCRIDTGKGAIIIPTSSKKKLINIYHFGSENIAYAYSSWIVPKGSPLQVQNIRAY